MKRIGRARMSFLRCERAREARCFAASAFAVLAFLSANADQHRDASEAKATVESSATPGRDHLLAVPIQSGIPPVLPANAIVAQLVATSARRSSQLRGFRATRDYHLQYRGLL